MKFDDLLILSIKDTLGQVVNIGDEVLVVNCYSIRTLEKGFVTKIHPKSIDVDLQRGGYRTKIVVGKSVKIPKVYSSVIDMEYLKKLDFLEALKAVGVDNWDGYSYAWDYLYENHPEYKEED